MDRVRGLIGCGAAYEKKNYGKGIGIAVLDSGVQKHMDLRGRVMVFQDYIHHRVKPYDDNSHGTHVAGILAGSGACSKGKYMGVAPLSHLLVCKVLDSKGNGQVKSALQAIDWIVKNREIYKIRILNISVGGIPKENDEEEVELLQAVEYAWGKGIVVVAAAGNNGPKTETITIPGISRKIITVGSYESINKKQKAYSGRGPTGMCVMKPEILAPGNEIVSCYGKNSYCKMTGTSMATPIVSGAIALLLEKHPDMTPKDVKYSLYKTAKDCEYPKCIQGWGLVDIKELTKL